MAKGVMYFSIGTDLLHDYDVSPRNNGGVFNVAHFMKHLGSTIPGISWSVLMNIGPVPANMMGFRPMALLTAKIPSNALKDMTIDDGIDRITELASANTPLHRSVGKALVTTSIRINSTGCGRYSKTLERGKIKNFHREMEQPLYIVLNKEFSGAASNCSGRVLHTDIGHLVDKMKAVKGRIGWPLFTVCDCNSFHNVAYVLGAYALDIATAGDADGPVLVINFDQHDDLGSYPQSIVRSDGWGAQLLGRYRRGAYVVIGSGGETRIVRGGKGPNQVKYSSKTVDAQQVVGFYTGELREIMRGPFRQRKMVYPEELEFTTAELTDLNTEQKKVDLKLKFNGLWDHIFARIRGEEAFGHDFFKHVYVTVDRDCMKYNYTCWKDIKSVFDSFEQVKSLMDILLETLKTRGCTLAGLDVTGLPEADGLHIIKGVGMSEERKFELSDLLAGAKVGVPGLDKELKAYHGIFKKY